MYITEAVVKRFGKSKGCDACRGWQGPHTAVCRQRMERLAEEERRAEEIATAKASAATKLATVNAGEPGFEPGGEEPAAPGPMASGQEERGQKTPRDEGTDVTMDGDGSKRARHVGFEPGAGLLAEGVLLGGEAEVHYFLPLKSASRFSTNASRASWESGDV